MKKKIFSRKHIVGILCCAAFAAILLPSSCKKEKDAFVINGAGPQPVLPAQTYSYAHGDNNLATLGRVLFYDKNLSLNNAISCGSCHQQKFAFADNKQFSQGLFNGYTSRNASTIISPDFSVARNRFWDGRAGNSDTAVFMPVMNNVEMHVFDLNILPDKLSRLSYYPELFTNAYGSPDITVAGIRKALAFFVECLVSHNSKFDRSELTATESQGEMLFQGKAKCYSCHNSENFNGYVPEYENIGLDVTYADWGVGKITHSERDKGKFMVPTLRNIAFTAPYMHDGRYNTLREVIDHYDHGIQDSRNLSWMLRDLPVGFFDTLSVPLSQADFSAYPPVRLNLTEVEKQQLEAFLNALSDPEFITDPKFSDPFK